MLAAVEPGTGRVQALAVNRNYRLDDRRPQNKLSTDPAKASRTSRATTRTRPTRSHRRRRHHRLPGRLDVQDVHHGGRAGEGLPARLHDQRAERRTKSELHRRAERRRPPAGHALLVPDQRQPERWPASHNMWTGFGSSVNTYFVPLEEQVGAENVVDDGRSGSASSSAQPSDADAGRTEQRRTSWGAFTLGVSATTPLELANAYATLAADGKYCEPIPVQRDPDPDGKKLDVGQPALQAGGQPEVARAAVDAARCPVGDQSASSASATARTAGNVRGIVGTPVAGKTGTTDRDKTAALVAMTKQLAVAGIMADPDWPQTNQKRHKDARTASTRRSTRRCGTP